MTDERTKGVIEAYKLFLADKAFPCVAAKAAIAHDQVRVMVCDHIACPKDDWAITQFIYDFVEEYRRSQEMYTSAVVIFKEPTQCSEEYFDTMMWQRLQSISDLDAQQFGWKADISRDPSSPHFSFCLKEEPFYILGLHPGSSRRARRFQHPALVFNPHDQFEKLRDSGKYTAMKTAVRKRDEIYSGSVNPMLSDFGEASEVLQYSGRVYDGTWKCPFTSNHINDEHHSPT
jgi:FPC/CPF motif-containing protein YcgG